VLSRLMAGLYTNGKNVGVDAKAVFFIPGVPDFHSRLLSNTRPRRNCLGLQYDPLRFFLTRALYAKRDQGGAGFVGQWLALICLMTIIPLTCRPV
jgi:hypothetical protein